MNVRDIFESGSSVTRFDILHLNMLALKFQIERPAIHDVIDLIEIAVKLDKSAYAVKFISALHYDDNQKSELTNFLDGFAHFRSGRLGMALSVFAGDWETPELIHEAGACVAAILMNRSKEEMYDAIKRINNADVKAELMEKCLSKETRIGAFFWHARGIFKCSLDGGVLKKIKDDLALLRPAHQAPAVNRETVLGAPNIGNNQL